MSEATQTAAAPGGEKEKTTRDRAQFRILTTALMRIPRRWTISLAVVFAGLVGWVNHAAGFELHLTAFYLLPICWTCWAVGRTAALAMAAACTAVFVVANMSSGHAYEHPLFAYWNALVLFLLFVVVVQLLASLQVAYRAAREGEARFQALFEQPVVGVAQLHAPSGRLVRVNLRFCDIFGYRPEECLGLGYQSLTHPDDLPLSVESVRRLIAGDVRLLSVEKRCLRKDGKVVRVNVTKLPLWSAGQTPDFYLELIEDTTRRAELEERLRQSQKLEAVGHLAGGMAHEFNNLLAALLMNLNLTQRLCYGREAGEMLTEAEGLCRRGSDLIKHLLAFSRKSILRLQPLDMAAVISEQCALLRRLLGERVFMEFVTPGPLPPVSADRALIQQVLMNLCLNARDALGERNGRLEIRLTQQVIQREQATLHPGATPGNYVCLSVTDTGCGMDEGTRKRLFEPFFTTKRVGEGTGLGLATALGIVQQHGGWIDVESTLGKGSTFRVYLPSVTSEQPELKTAEPTPPAPGHGTILLVEDEPALRRLTKRLLTQQGYEVVEAASGDEAVRIWDQRCGEIDLVFTDMVMPGEVNGQQLAEKVLADKPGVKVIITSGYPTGLASGSNSTGQPIVWLPKPSLPNDLLAVVRECLQPEEPRPEVSGREPVDL